MRRQVAMVTGASRGIGRATALALARAGFDVIITARTMREGEGRVQGSSSIAPKEVAVAGSLETTAATIREAGREVLPIRMDLLDPPSVEAAVAEALSTWRRIDLLVNNAIYQGAGRMDRLLDIPPEAMKCLLEGNVLAQFTITQLVLRAMVEEGGGTIINMTSRSGHSDPPGPTGKGGWGYAYAASKGALHRMVPILHQEHRADGVRAFNVDPGYTPTETMRALRGSTNDLDAVWAGAPVEVTAEVIAWLATAAEADPLAGTTVNSHLLCAELGLVAGWDGRKYTPPAGG
jgi:NAD(P)-dependent dehydrogenase (short-subunit alcohol dehydrogenase family)